MPYVCDTGEMRYHALLWLVGIGCSSEPARDTRIETAITLQPGQESYGCYRVNIDADIFVSRILTATAPGVHHQILGVTDQEAPEGYTECGLALAEVDAWLFIGTDKPGELAMPDGVAYPLEAGRQVVMQLHLFNATEAPIESTVSAELVGIAEDALEQRAQMVAAGTLNLDLPPGQATTARGTCTLREDVNMFGMAAHTHALGTSFEARLVGPADERVIMDKEVSGEPQLFETFEPIAIAAGSKLEVECGYFNSTNAPVGYGQSAFDEMCFGYTYYYPAIESQSPLCLN